jgi:hypothetical protein
MAERDPKRERMRLAQRYAGMSDADLRETAEDARSLTEEATAALRAEIARRGLDIVVDDSGPMGTPAPPVVLRRFLWLPEALLAKSILDSAGVECILADEHTIRMDWFWSLGLGGVKLWVSAEDADAAGLLDQNWIESFVVAGAEEYKQPRCPNCGSFEISHRNFLKRLAYLSLLAWWLTAIVPPIALHELGWRCYACGHLWGDSRDDRERVS